MTPLPREFYARDAERVARSLVGTVLVHRTEDRVLRARIVETEAYVGAHDLACHAARGRTARTEVMFGDAGYAYVYLVYGMHHMLNAVTGRPGDPQAVLIRAAEPMDGLAARLDGPGRLCRAFGITRAHNGTDLCAGALFVAQGHQARRLVSGPRVGVDYAGDWARAPLRFFDGDSEAVSRRPVRSRS